MNDSILITIKKLLLMCTINGTHNLGFADIM